MLYWADASLYVLFCIFVCCVIKSTRVTIFAADFFCLYIAFYRDRIERATLTGENRQVIMQGVQYPFAMTVFKQDIFWTDWTERAVFRAGKDDGSGFAVLAQDMQYRPNDIHVYAASKQESCSSSCQQFNGGCSHICVSGKNILFGCY